MLKVVMKTAIVVAVLVLCAYLFGFYQNNRDVPRVATTDLQQQLEKSIQWLVQRKPDLLNEANPMLWWMLYEVHKLSQDPRIENLLESYYSRYGSIRLGLWSPLFGSSPNKYIGAADVQSLPYYNQHIIFALNCASDIALESPLVAQQNQADFCHQPGYFYRPACTTHQLMGVNFLFTQRCDLVNDIDILIQSLQQDIVTQLTWDIRVVDVYLQRVLMLLITGAEASVKPVWIQQVLDQQLADGGWGDFDSLLGSGSELSVGFSSRVLSLGKERSTFHATAQGVYILSYLLSERIE